MIHYYLYAPNETRNAENNPQLYYLNLDNKIQKAVISLYQMVWFYRRGCTHYVSITQLNNYGEVAYSIHYRIDKAVSEMYRTRYRDEISREIERVQKLHNETEYAIG